MTNSVDSRRSFQVVGDVHGRLVHKRRVAVLAENLAVMIPQSSSLLDVGCGDGTISKLISEEVPGVQVTGAEYAHRPDCAIPCTTFDGAHLPFPDKSFDGCIFVDVLHHTLDPLSILKDACRVARKFVLIKDHLAENTFDHWTLRLMDWVGNRPHGVVLPYAYLSQTQWNQLYKQAGLSEIKSERSIPLYPVPFSWLFGRNLHFISLLSVDSDPKS
ncbi:MAG TPA: class I SAM-dependent methyltransferase [Terracidiphilus sp.]|jgi:ubiquinone/menaquinone biosynthesis C-methylase UbiE